MNPSHPARLAVLVSGRGSNLQAILDACQCHQLYATVVGVFSNRLHTPALERVAAPLRWAPQPTWRHDRRFFDQALAQAVAAVRPDWIVCAGFMHLLSPAFLDQFPNQVINIHPSLLPLYRGLRTHERAIAAGDHQHGASVHYVVPALDAGPVLSQVRVPIHPDDTPDTLAARVLVREHPLLIATLRFLVADRFHRTPDGVLLDRQPLLTPLQLTPANQWQQSDE